MNEGAPDVLQTETPPSKDTNPLQNLPLPKIDEEPVSLYEKHPRKASLPRTLGQHSPEHCSSKSLRQRHCYSLIEFFCFCAFSSDVLLEREGGVSRFLMEGPEEAPSSSRRLESMTATMSAQANLSSCHFCMC